MKINVFLSLAGEEGLKEAENLKRELEAITEPNGLQFRCYLYSKDESGGSLIENYLNKLEKCNFFIPVLTTEYVTSRFHIGQELNKAIKKEEYFSRISDGRFKFIFPYAPKDGQRLIDNISLISELKFYSDVKTLANSMVQNSAFALLNEAQCEIGFEKNWPRSFFDNNGKPDVLLVLGHSGKEDPPSIEDIRNLKICSIEEDLAERYKKRPDRSEPRLPAQSMRIAEYIPKLIHFLSNQYLSLNPSSRVVPCIKADIDWHLIKHRQSLLESNNLICFGAGDTNWISRAVLAYYGTLLPVVFDSPGDSRVIFYKAVDPNTAQERTDTSGRIEIAEYSESMDQVPADDGQFGAILLLLPNPWNIKKRVIIAAGLTGLGSQASILALCDPSISVMPHGGIPWARVIRGKQGKNEQLWQAIGFDVVA